MRRFPRFFFLLVVCSCLFTADTQARHRRHRDSDAATGASASPPGSASARIAKFLDRYLESAILLPLDRRARLPRKELGSLSLDFNNQLAVASAADRPALAEAVAVCNTLSAIMDERERLLQTSPPPATASSPSPAPIIPSDVPADLRAASTTDALIESRRARQKRQSQARRQEREDKRLLLAQRRQQWAEICSRHRQSIYGLSARVRAAETQGTTPDVSPRSGVGASVSIAPAPGSVPAIPAPSSRPAATTTLLPPATVTSPNSPDRQ